MQPGKGCDVAGPGAGGVAAPLLIGREVDLLWLGQVLTGPSGAGARRG